MTRRALVVSLLALALVVAPLSLAPPAGAGVPVPPSHFTDVPPNHPFSDDIEWAVTESIVSGFPDGTYRPTQPLARQAFAAMLYRMFDGEPVIPAQPTFSDVPADHPFADEIEWAADQGLVEGFDDGTFRPRETVTRAASAAIFSRSAERADTWVASGPAATAPAMAEAPAATAATGPPAAAPSATLPPISELTLFPDVDRAHPFLVDIHTAAGLGLVNGFADGSYGPELPLLRQEVAALLRRTDQWTAITYEPEFVPAPCTVPTPAGRTTVCGTLVVPEDRADPNSPNVHLAVAIVKTNSATPRADAAVYLGGGPGGTVMDSLPGRYKAVLGEHRDVILFDQRGVGLSQPNLDCPERDEALWTTYSTAEPFADELVGLVDATAECRDRLLAAGVELSAYNTVQSAFDVRDLRRALGYHEWNVYGVSYGTSLAQQVMRTDPFGTRTVIHDSVLPNLDLGPERLSEAADRVFDHLWAGCAADTSCAASHPDLGAEFAAVVADYDQNPLALSIPDPAGGPDRPLLLTGADLTGGLFAALYRTDVIPLLPTVIAAAGTRDPATLGAIASQGLAQLTELVDGVFLSVECHDRGVANGRELVEDLMLARPDLGSLFFTAAFAYCETWNVPDAPAAFKTLPVSDIPSLVLAGSYDPITPPIGGQAVHAALVSSTYAEFPRYGHGILSASNSCAVTLARALLTAPDDPPDTTCLAAELPPDFL